MYNEPILNDPNKPLVSVLIFNYNYGRYLRECLDSVFTQTYENIEICLSDNASTDDSWNIALEYARKYPGIMTITRNRRNFGLDANFANCFLNARGKYFIQLCSDNALMPEYIKQCVNALESHPSAAFAMVHRMLINKHGQRSEEPPFYNQSCIIPGVEQASVYLMAEVNLSISQIMYNKRITFEKITAGARVASHWYCIRIMDFDICCKSPIIYIKDPLLMHRLHSHNHLFLAAKNLMEIIEPYVLQHQFAEMSSIYNLPKLADRLPQSLDKLSNLCLLYCVRALTANDEKYALRYYHLAAAIAPDVADDPTFKKLEEYWASDVLEKSKIVELLKSTDNLMTRSVSYDPPPGSVPLEISSLTQRRKERKEKRHRIT